MITEPHRITVAGITVDVVRKDIKNLHLGVYPPNGRVRVAAPLLISDDAVRLAVVDKLPWIKAQKAKFQNQPRQSKREMVNGESHYFLGRRYRLRVTEQSEPARVVIRGVSTLELVVQPGTSTEKREAILSAWYREQLRTLAAPLIEKWQDQLGVQVAGWGIKKMKTLWGSCNAKSGRIWLNLELAKKPEPCIEYIVVHELLHLIEPRHNDRFLTLLDQHLPTWRPRREMLNATPLGHETWDH